MERFVRLVAPTGKIDFVVKLLFLNAIGGGLNHLRHVLTHGFPGHKPFMENLIEASFTALPMCAFALILIGHLNFLQKHLYIQATRDVLTGLNNRRWFMDNTPSMIGQGATLMIVDLDHFKSINDRFGHDVGDKCLCDMALHLRANLGEGNKFARIGGEEFAVFVTSENNDDVEDIAQRISNGFTFDTCTGTKLEVRASVGVATPTIPWARTDVLRLADEAVYLAKAKGRACYVKLTEKEMVADVDLPQVQSA